MQLFGARGKGESGLNGLDKAPVKVFRLDIRVIFHR